jgi:hypothetical protein
MSTTNYPRTLKRREIKVIVQYDQETTDNLWKTNFLKTYGLL